MRFAQALVLLLVALAPRVYLWGSVPVSVHGDEAGFSAVGDDTYEEPVAPWLFGPNNLPMVHYWVIGYVRHFWPDRDTVWSARAISSLFGLAQALAVVALAAHGAGFCGALTAAIVMAHAMMLSFERTVWCQVWTTGCWTLALWLVVRWPRARSAAIAAGALVAASFYAYQASRISLAIAGAGLFTLLVTTPAGSRARLMIRVAQGLGGFAIVIAPFAYGIWLTPPAWAGRMVATSWLATEHASLAFAWQQFSMTVRAMADGTVVTGVPMVLAWIGFCAAPSAALGVTLAVWTVLVMVGSALRMSLYAEALVCAMPALALGAAYVTRVPGVRRVALLVPVLFAWLVWPPLRAYYPAAAQFHGDSQAWEFYRQFLAAQPPEARFLMMHGCGHGITRLALHHRRCEDTWTTLPATIPPHATVIAFPTYWAPTAAEQCRAAGLPTYEVQWATAPAVVCGDAVVMPP
jgi:hypothetical protein